MDDNKIGIVDYITMFGTVILCTGVGFYHSIKSKHKTQSVEGYLLANRMMAVVPAAFSILATKLSGISIAGATGEEYVYGPQYSFIFIGYFFGQLVVALYVVPVFRRGNYISIYEYLERRFDKSVRLTFAVLYLIMNLFYVGIVLYVPAVSVTALSGLPFEITVVVTGLTCTIYCVMGGFSTVVWTDVVQTFIMFLSFLLVIGKGVVDAGGPVRIWQECVDTGYITAFSFVESTTLRYSVWSTFALGMQSSFRDLCIGQAGIQRILSVKDTKAAQRSTMISAMLGFIFMWLLLMSSVVLYVDMHNCDPLQRKTVTGVTTPDQIFVYGMAKLLRNLPGLTGIAMSGIISGAISSFSSQINAFAAVTLEDFLRPFAPSLVDTEKKKIMACKLLTAFYGIFSILFAFLVPHFGGAVKSTISIVSIFAGPLVGVVFMAIFCKRYHKKACYIGLYTAIAVCLTLQLGSQWTKVKHDTMPLSLEGCPGNKTFSPDMFYGELNNVTLPYYEKPKPSGFFLLFTISFMWYGPIGVIISMVVGYVASLFSEYKYIDPELMHSPMARLSSPTKENGRTTKPLIHHTFTENDEKTRECGV